MTPSPTAASDPLSATPTLYCVLYIFREVMSPPVAARPSECHTYFTLCIVYYFQGGPGYVAPLGCPRPLSATPTLHCVLYIFRDDPVTSTPTAASDVLPAREHDVLAADEYVAPTHVSRGEAAQVNIRLSLGVLPNTCKKELIPNLYCNRGTIP